MTQHGCAKDTRRVGDGDRSEEQYPLCEIVIQHQPDMKISFILAEEKSHLYVNSHPQLKISDSFLHHVNVFSADARLVLSRTSREDELRVSVLISQLCLFKLFYSENNNIVTAVSVK